MNSTGYSGTPLAKKLGIKEGNSIQVFNAPKDYLDFFMDFPKNVHIVDAEQIPSSIDFIHIFCKTKEELGHFFSIAKPNLKKDGMLWISWPKKSSQIKTDIEQMYILNFGLDNGLVDTKVAAIDADWSGHKFVYRTKDR
ncbi:DUF3052 domain-containing protein [Allomuricauda sp. NBRC 101325]|uniref:DUF3052 domain-containing protein n=1 Tax=Allomuricauda sp. NBRC 101325 TaxID=1113758 RepID=UPI0024A10759|nr:DUF3052 domain-containing protein [Muricauda sp. NBRC 101325]GLU45033.1 DUF3052 domain-containing protein [Muricauda sp. NBRC 101325]